MLQCSSGQNRRLFYSSFISITLSFSEIFCHANLIYGSAINIHRLPLKTREQSFFTFFFFFFLIFGGGGLAMCIRILLVSATVCNLKKEDAIAKSVHYTMEELSCWMSKHAFFMHIRKLIMQILPSIQEEND